MTDRTVVKSLITPHDQTLRTVFNTQRAYFIDIYQREYKWKQDEVKTLLNDIEVRFEQHARRQTQPKEIQEDVLDRFEPYFLNTYLTHTTAANISIVDGQQRLTTLLLMLIKLYRILKMVEQDSSNLGKTFSSRAVEQLILETNDFGDAERFKIFNENREDAFRALVENHEIDAGDETRQRIKENYKYISDYFDSFLGAGQPVAYDLVKSTYYITYLLDRVSIVEIRIERQDNVAMIFEVVNDRGLGLKPYEILKGKLIGNLSQSQKEKANEVWTSLQERYFKAELKNATEKTIDLDMFFQTFFRSKFADSELEYERFESDYHYEMYRNPRVLEYFDKYHNRELLFRRIVEDVRYFAELYLEIRTTYESEPLIFNKLLDQNQQYLLIMSAVNRDDPERSAKVTGIASKFDQFHAVLRLLDAYDSQAFQRLVYPLNRDVRNRPVAESKQIFERSLIDTLVTEGILQANQCADVSAVFEFERFKGVHNQSTNFSKYVLMRVDRYLADLLDKPSYAGGDLEELENRFNKNNLKRYGMHLEHIYTHHQKNRSLFTVDGTFDEARFNQTRNLLGMVLLLKDKQNLSSGNEIYADKLNTYATSNLIWNELLAGSLPEVDFRRLPTELQLPRIKPTGDGVFPDSKIEERQRAVFIGIKSVWGNV